MELRALLLSVTVAPLVLTQDATRFARVPGVRCAERAGDYPLGDVGAEWNQELESEAKLRCFGDPECLGVMHYVGSNPHHCKEWCGRPQFCTLDGPINPNSDWISFIKADMMQELQRAPAEDHNAQDSVDAEEVARGWREVTCPATEWSSAATDRPKVVLLSRSLTDLPVPGACHVLREEPGILLEPGDQAIPDGILSQTEREGLRFFAAESGPGDVSGSRAQGPWRLFMEGSRYPRHRLGIPNKKHFLSMYFLSAESTCVGPQGSQIGVDEAEATLPGHVYVEDGTDATRQAAFESYRMTLMCGDFEAEPFPPTALIWALAFASHPMVPEGLRNGLSRAFFHLQDAAQPFRALDILKFEAFFKDMFDDPEKENIVLFKQTFMLLCQQLLWYRYRDPPKQREEAAACAVCNGLERERRRVLASPLAAAESRVGAASQSSSLARRSTVAVVFSSMSRRTSHVLRRTVRETWASLLGRLQGVSTALRFFVGQGPTPLEDGLAADGQPLEDIVQLPVPESYRTINVKAFAMLSWSFEAFPNMQWLVRHDDDVYLRPQVILGLLAKRPPVRYLWGNFDHGSAPVREEGHPHYNSYQQMPERKHPMWGDVFPPYARGHLWAMSVDLLGEIVSRWKGEIHSDPDSILDESVANQLPHPDDPALGVVISNLVHEGMSINLDDRDFNQFSLNPSCNSSFSNIHNRTWVVHHVSAETLRCMWAVDSAAEDEAGGVPGVKPLSHVFPDLCQCSTEVAEEPDAMEGDTPFWYPRQRFSG